jgi:hypothetical protein
MQQSRFTKLPKPGYAASYTRQNDRLLGQSYIKVYSAVLRQHLNLTTTSGCWMKCSWRW